jgi:hypothetical protein
VNYLPYLFQRAARTSGATCWMWMCWGWLSALARLFRAWRSGTRTTAMWYISTGKQTHIS